VVVAVIELVVELVVVAVAVILETANAVVNSPFTGNVSVVLFFT